MCKGLAKATEVLMQKMQTPSKNNYTAAVP
jgi:hypothetical protein